MSAKRHFLSWIQYFFSTVGNLKNNQNQTQIQNLTFLKPRWRHNFNCSPRTLITRLHYIEAFYFFHYYHKQIFYALKVVRYRLFQNYRQKMFHGNFPYQHQREIVITPFFYASV
ncbi:unnamed protein product [Tenebrio molitor]|nr:unnamed protein product [Tenebrio molitor]